MGRAIVRDPHVFLFDEPLSNLDAKLRGQVRTVTLGIRHEAMVPEPMVRPMTEPFGLDADITLVQPLGGEALLFLQMGEAEVTTRVSRPNARLVPERGVRFVTDLADLHLFDREGGARLRNTPDT